MLRLKDVMMSTVGRTVSFPKEEFSMGAHHLKDFIALLDRAIKSEHEENRQLRSGCHEDCREYEWTPLQATIPRGA